MMHWQVLFGAVLSATKVRALLRFPCSQLVVERFDPLLTPGIVSPHLHQIVGGNAFDVAMDLKNDLPAMSTCTTCTYSEDFSNYWTAVLYFKHANGSYKRVPQKAETLVGNPNGGMTLYYSQPNNGGKVTSFPKGFRMIVGDPMLRSYNSSDPEARSLNFRCLAADDSNGGAVGAPGTDSNYLFDKPCVGGIRSQIVFPSCWDGVNVDTPNHKNHVAYARNGVCPSTHPVTVPSIFIETVWDTAQFNSMWPTGTPNPFVFSMGDPTGTGQHADYVFGWKGDALQRAMDQCHSYGGPCPTLKTQSDEAINSCVQRSRVREPIDGWLPALPGCNPIQPGPGRATPVPDCGAPNEYDPAGGPGSPLPAATAAPGGTIAARYAQCGGQGYTGPTTCQAPYTCKASNQGYSQCL